MKVSIIVPVYNVENYLRSSLDSLVHQNFDDYEIILINDGSTDNSLSILEEYASLYDNIVLIDKKNEGQAVARNLAIKKARGEYLMFVDSDDYIEKDTLKITYNKAINDECDIVCFKSKKVYDDKEVVDDLDLLGKTDKETFIINQAGPCFMLIKTDLIRNNNLYFPHLRAYEDIAVVPAYCLYASKIGFIDDVLYSYVIRKGSTMQQVSYNKKLEDIFFALDNLSSCFEKFDYDEELEFIYVKHLLHGAGLRFLNFDKMDSIYKIISIMKGRFPKFRKNKYFKKQSFKYRVLCILLYKKKFGLLKFLRG